MDEVWLKHIFSGAGKIIQVYIPWKRSFRLNQRFGFVRYGNKEDGMKAIKMWNTAQIQGHRLLVKEARFNNTRWNKQGQKKVGETKVYRVVKNKNPRAEEPKWIPKSQKAPMMENRSNRSAIKSGNGAQPCIKVSEVGNEWLTRSAIAELSPLRSMVYMQDHLRNLGYSDIQVRPMDSDRVVLTFPNIEDRDSIFNGGKMGWLKDCFLEIFKWNDTVSTQGSRLVWLNCYGIPLHVWNVATFNKIGQIWGKIISISEDSFKSLSFTVGKVLISTTTMETINQCKGCVLDEVKSVAQNSNGYEENIVEEMVETNEEAEKAVGSDGGSLQLVKVGMHGGNYGLATRDSFSSSSGIGLSVRGSGKVKDTLGEGAGNNSLPITINLAPLTVIGLNRMLLSPRISLSNLVENQAAKSVSWVANSVNENLALPGILSERNDEDANGDGRLDQNEVNHTEDDPILAPLKAAINGVKGKKKRKSIYDILGFTKVNPVNNKGRKNKQKCEVFRSAIAAVALSASISSGGIVNINRIILDEAQAIWECNKIMGMGYDGDEDEVISRFADMEAQDLDRADRAATRQL
ncbi:hypothetical protein RHGRI_015184 [Rhododendron griersonianum]|uniref:RRM domain-containing protein n=1 Tax=Rhododendron griersonianum TaxID=479676 RepID=A0AAV6KCU6_9ERIC|nr:hypothetical protein RHGRI_015184 [Rhododendron griersonianum]